MTECSEVYMHAWYDINIDLPQHTSSIKEQAILDETILKIRNPVCVRMHSTLNILLWLYTIIVSFDSIYIRMYADIHLSYDMLQSIKYILAGVQLHILTIYIHIPGNILAGSFNMSTSSWNLSNLSCSSVDKIVLLVSSEFSWKQPLLYNTNLIPHICICIHERLSCKVALQ